MLLIGDIHIYPRYTDQTIQMLRDYITSHADETDIIFVGDYVYHFSYHKPSLLALLDLWIDIAHSGKTLYILAGNHDRLGQHFVYAEAEKIISHHNQSSNIHFITTPQTHTIGGETIIFLPYMIQRSEYTPQSDSYDFPLHLDVCKDSTHNSTKTSYLLNTCIADMITKERKSDTNKELILIHHYYTAERVFPGLKTKFGYKDIALSPHRLEEKNLRIISGHIHHSFVDQNYLCLGAVRYTSPLESNSMTYLFRYHTGQVTATQIALNPYLTLTHSHDGGITINDIQDHRSSLQSQSQGIFDSNSYDVEIIGCDLPLTRTTLTLVSDMITYDNLTTHLPPELHQTLRDTKIKQPSKHTDLIIEDLISSHQNFSSGRSDRKILLDDYLQQKFGDQTEKYKDVLKELGI